MRQPLLCVRTAHPFFSFAAKQGPAGMTFVLAAGAGVVLSGLGSFDLAAVSGSGVLADEQDGLARASSIRSGTANQEGRPLDALPDSNRCLR
jgi:hypothetical protein